MSNKQAAELKPQEVMDAASLACDAAAFAKAYLDSIYGISMNDQGVYARHSLGEGYVLRGEEPIGRYSFAESLWYAVRLQRENFATRDRLMLDRKLVSGDELAAAADNPKSTEARIDRDMIEFVIEVAFRLGANEEQLIPNNLVAIVEGEPHYEG